MAGADAVEDLAGPVLMDLHLSEAGAMSDDVGGEEHAGDKPAITADEEIGDTTLDAAEPRQGAATRTGALLPRADIADAIPDQRHRMIEQVGHEDTSHLSRLRGPITLHNFNAQPLRHDVQSLVSVALAGDHAD